MRQAAATDGTVSAASAGATPRRATARGTASDELAKLASLHQRGVLNDEEFARAKSRATNNP